MLARFFEFEKHGTNYRQEALGGVTTFLTMAYIIVVNPLILSKTGKPIDQLTTATIIAAVAGTLLMAFYAKRPFAVAPYMGENAFIAFVVCAAPAAGGLGFSWDAAMTAILIGGILFVLLTIFKLRSWLANAIPKNLKYAFVVGIGLFLTFIGLVDTGIVATNLPNAPEIFIFSNPASATIGLLSDANAVIMPRPLVPVKIGLFTSPVVLLAIFGFVFMGLLMALKVRGAIMIGILTTSALAFALKALGVDFPPFAVEYPKQILGIPAGLGEVAFKFDFKAVFSMAFLPVLLTVFLMDFVDTMGTLIGVSSRAKFLDKDGNLPQIEKPMMADAVATVVGAISGTTTTGAYIESAAGIEEGGRTGFSALITAGLFLLALIFTPVLTAIPSCAYGPALIIVGLLMIGAVKNIDFSDLTELIPAFAVIILMSFTYNLGVGITAGFVLYPLLKLVTGRVKEVNAGTWVLGAISLLFYIFYPGYG